MTIKEEILNFLDGLNEESDLFDGEIIPGRLYAEFEEDTDYGISPYKFKLMWGATRLVINPIGYDWVIKIPFSNRKDYCELEVAIYKDAIDENLSTFFAKEQFICYFAGNRIYAQEKADVDVQFCIDSMYEYYLDHYDEDEFFSQQEYINIEDYTYSLASNEDYQPIDSLLLGLFDAADEFDKLNSFIFEHNINDLHYANIGFQDGLPLFIDYAGFGKEL